MKELFVHYVLLLLTECEIKNVISKTTLEDVLFSYLFIYFAFIPSLWLCSGLNVSPNTSVKKKSGGRRALLGNNPGTPPLNAGQ